MNKLTNPKKLDAVATAAPQVPALSNRPSKWKQFRRLMNDLDEIRERDDDLYDLMGDLRNRKSGEPPPDLQDAQLSDYDKQKIARCHQWLPDIDRADYYEEGDEDEGPILKRKIISDRLALMLGAVHIGGPQTPEAFLKMLLEHVYDAEVSYLALESGCRQIEQTQKYVPAISELLKVLNEHQKQWATRKWALGGIESLSNNLQEQIRKAQPRYERERAEKRFDEAKKLLEQDVWQINAAQERARQAYQNVEAGMDQLAKDRAALDAGIAAVAAPPVSALSQPRSEWQQFRILMNDLDEVRNWYDNLHSQLYGRSGGEPPPELRYLLLLDSDKHKLARCRQWLRDIDREDYYEEAIVVRADRTFPTIPRLSEETISGRISVMLTTVCIGGSQDPEIFRQNLLQYVYGAQVSYLVLESACREIEQTGKCPTISEVLEILKKHRERWDKRKTALHFIESVQKQYARKRLKEAEDLLRKRQEEAREAYQWVEATMGRLAKDQQRSAEAKAALDAAGAAAKVADEPKGDKPA